MRLSLAPVLALMFALAPNPADAQADSPFAPYVGKLRADEQQWFADLFADDRAAFVAADGRVVDGRNGGISHSESQGYGMLLALLGNDRDAFDTIWRFTRENMQREDKLFGWKYVPGRGVVDWQNATDGDLFIATALALAGSRWTDDTLLQADGQRAGFTGARRSVGRAGRRAVQLQRADGRTGASFSDVAYRFSYELLACTDGGAPITLDTVATPMTNYYASSLHLMGLARLYASYPGCFPR